MINLMGLTAGTSRLSFIAEPSQIVFTTTTNWVVPAGVYSISAVCRQRGTTAGETWTSVPGAKIARGGTDLVRALNGNRLGDGGGDGGMSGAQLSNTNGVTESGGIDYYWYAGGGGGGGAGGYNGAGGDGGSYKDSAEGGGDTDWVGKSPAANSGGGGGGICGAKSYASGGGGGGGLNGIGSNGVPGAAWPSTATGGSSGQNGGTTPSGESWQSVGTGNGGLYGGAAGDVRGSGTYSARGRGGACAWKNNIAVTPGETLTITVEGNGGVRVLWGVGRSYPSNAASYLGPGFFRYYRLNITARSGASDYTSIAEIELHTSIGGSDITTSTSPCYASSYYGVTQAPGKLVDNIRAATTDCWLSSTSSLPQWVYIDTGTYNEPRVVELLMYPHPITPGRTPGAFVVQGSNDASNWTDIKTFTDVTGWVAGTPKTFALY